MMELLKRALDHMAWADGAVLEALKASASPDPAALELLGHVLGAEHVWLARLDGRPPTVAVWPKLGVAECTSVLARNRDGLLQSFGTLAPGDLTRTVHYRTSAGDEFDSSIGDILLHVCLHGAYHRGQVAWLLRRGGGVPPPTDYIGFVRGVPAATRQPHRP